MPFCESGLPCVREDGPAKRAGECEPVTELAAGCAGAEAEPGRPHGPRGRFPRGGTAHTWPEGREGRPAWVLGPALSVRVSSPFSSV